MAKARWITTAGALLALAGGAVQAHEVRDVRHVHAPVVVVAPHAPVRTWVPGHWEHRGPARIWVQGHWVHAAAPHRPHGHHGHWERTARWDQDRDGIANRHDRDRDGDGVPNWRDHAPSNPRWR